MAKRPDVTCDDCYFRKCGLCALLLPEPCPTFRAVDRGLMRPPAQPTLVPRPLSAFAHGAAPA